MDYRAYLCSMLLLATGLAAVAQQSIILKPDAVEGKDVEVWNLGPNSNYAERPNNVVYTWTCSGQLCLKRSFLEFDLTQVPEGATILYAGLSLFYNPADIIESFNGHTGDNGALIQRVLLPWDEYTITWSNQPVTTIQNQVVVPPTSNPTQDLIDIDVTALVTDMLENPTEGHGFMIRMDNEQDFYRGLLLASSDHPDKGLHPELTILYELATPVDTAKDKPLDFTVVPNPAQDVITLFFEGTAPTGATVEICNALGQSIQAAPLQPGTLSFDVSGLPSGPYWVRVFDHSRLVGSRLVVVQRQ